VSTLGKVDPDWICSFFASISKMTAENYATLRTYDADSLNHIKIYVFVSSVQCQVPEVARRKSVMNQACAGRAEECGSRIQFWAMSVSKGISPEGKIDWGMLGVYALEVNKDRQLVGRVLHRPTDTWAVIDITSYIIRPDWDLKMNWSDFGAKVRVHRVPEVHFCGAQISVGVDGCSINLIYEMPTEI